MFRGLTWDHPRGYDPLDAAAHATPELALVWDRQPLEGFESRPIAELCDKYDLIVLDHPHVGEAVEAGCVLALEDVFDSRDIEHFRRDCVGQSFSSYRFDRRHWALPIDAASQVMAYRRDLVATPPRTWREVLSISEKVPVVLSLAGPHAFLTFQSICVAIGERPGATEGRFVTEEACRAAYDLMAQLIAAGPSPTKAFNPIGILDHMVANRNVALCPLIYGYCTYSRDLGFADAPEAGGGIGSTLGGTGIAISRRCQVTPALKTHLMWLTSSDVQRGFIPRHGGQPALRAAWIDEQLNAETDNFYRNTLSTLEDAYLRPRLKGAIAFQSDASEALRDALFGGQAAGAFMERLQALYARYIGLNQE